MKTAKVIEKQQLKIRSEFVSFKDIEEAPVNAQEMSNKDFDRLVYNLKRDGILTSTPLIMEQPGKNKYMCISGHHRIKAAIKAEINGAICLICEPLDDSTRIRIQLAHNDIHGNPNKDVLAFLQAELNDIDVVLVDNSEIERVVKHEMESKVNVLNFQYINICLVEESRERLVDMIMLLEKQDAINWLVTKPEYEKLTDLLTYAFNKGFKTPGQAFGKFMDIVELNKDEITRTKK
ncbi:MAG: ParB N-terminal domain-containing protein [Bacteroidales bacterium]